MAKAKKSVAKAATKTAAKPAQNKVNWTLAANGQATLEFSDLSTLTAIQVTLMLALDDRYLESAVIGDTVRDEDFLKVWKFDDALSKRPPASRFITAIFYNRSAAARSFDLVFKFLGSEPQRIKYTLAARQQLDDKIVVAIN